MLENGFGVYQRSHLLCVGLRLSHWGLEMQDPVGWPGWDRSYCWTSGWASLPYYREWSTYCVLSAPTDCLHYSHNKCMI